MFPGTPWSEPDEAELRRRYPDEPTGQIATDLARSVSSVYARAAKLGLSKSAAFKASELSGRITSARRHKIGSPLWTAEQERILREMWPNHRGEDIATLIGRPLSGIYKRATDLGLEKSLEFLNSALSGRTNLILGVDTRFQPNHVPWTKGRKGIRLAPEHTLFKKGAMPHNHLPVGSITSTSDGYRKVKIAEPNKWRHLHRYNWEEANGPIPPGMTIVFKDGDQKNCDISNLEMITRAELGRRNSINTYPPIVRSTMRALGKLRREISNHGEK